MNFIDKKEFKIPEATVLSIGKFDGEHRGHKKLFKKMQEIATTKSLKLAIFTFDTAPINILKTNTLVYTQISTNLEKRAYFEKMGIDYLVEYPFDKEFSMCRATDFVKDILIAKMNMKAIVVGEDCAFGYKKSGDLNLLKRLSKVYNYEVYPIKKEVDALNRDISSSLIKQLILKGDIGMANELLGYNYSIFGKVVHGNKIASQILKSPTANIFVFDEKTLPKFGVYATSIKLEGSSKTYLGLSNVGTNPTVKNDKENHKARIESYIYDFDEDIYEQEITISFIEFIREQRKFASLEELKTQIEKDKAEVYNKYGKQYDQGGERR